ncbi:MAG: DNA-binding CsgD family transcriptional regulator [Crocinitomix sp.]|jgi:DNA-binding CsgD family transcriptional regulator
MKNQRPFTLIISNGFRYYKMKKNVITFGLLIAALLILFQLSSYQLFKGNLTTELIIALVSVVFFFLGLYFRKKWSKELQADQKKGINYKTLHQLNMSDREHEVLQGIVAGLSNKEIGAQLFISESTIKSHITSLYSKLEVKKRPQAILKAHQLGIVDITEFSTKVP